MVLPDMERWGQTLGVRKRCCRGRGRLVDLNVGCEQVGDEGIAAVTSVEDNLVS